MADSSGTTGTENKSLTPDKRAQLSRYASKPPIMPILARLSTLPQTLKNGGSLADFFNPNTALDELAKFDPAMPTAPAVQTSMPLAKDAKPKRRNTILTGEEETATYRPSIGG
jgi:hypothetical protein